jgi:hypothetical protein
MWSLRIMMIQQCHTAMGGMWFSSWRTFNFYQYLIRTSLKVQWNVNKWTGIVSMTGLQFLSMCTLILLSNKGKVAANFNGFILFYLFNKLSSLTNVCTILVLAGLYSIYSIPIKSKFYSFTYILYLLFISSLFAFYLY